MTVGVGITSPRGRVFLILLEVLRVTLELLLMLQFSWLRWIKMKITPNRTLTHIHKRFFLKWERGNTHKPHCPLQAMPEWRRENILRGSATESSFRNHKAPANTGHLETGVHSKGTPFSRLATKFSDSDCPIRGSKLVFPVWYSFTSVASALLLTGANLLSRSRVDLWVVPGSKDCNLIQY